MARKSIVTFRVGLMIAVAVALLCFAIFSIGHGSRLFKRTDNLEAHFQSINGLQTGAPVTLAGMNIGAVDAIRFPRDPKADYVIVRMWIEQDALARIHSDSVAHISTMGLLGDKYVAISAGTPGAPLVRPGAVIPSRNPIDYATLLQKKGTGDLIANTIAISDSLRQLLASVEHGNGLLSQLIKGEPGVPRGKQLTLASIQQTMVNMNRLTSQLNTTLTRINRGQGLAGAFFSKRFNGDRMLRDMTQAARSMEVTSRKMNQLIDRFNNAQGVVPQLIYNRVYANSVMTNMAQASESLKEILHKINTGQGSVGMAVNDPTLYQNATKALSGSAGWGIGLMNALYGLTHPFYNPANEPSLTQSVGAESHGTSAPVSSSSTPQQPAPSGP